MAFPREQFEAEAYAWTQVECPWPREEHSWEWDWSWRPVTTDVHGCYASGFLVLRPMLRRILAPVPHCGCATELVGTSDTDLDLDAANLDTTAAVRAIAEQGVRGEEEATAGWVPQWVEFEFHVLWNATYGVPVCYFTAQLPDGTPLSAAATRRALNLATHQEHWTVLTQEEHPTLGVLAYTLHPCETAERMAAMLSGGGDIGQSHGGYLLSWFTVVAPLLQLTLRPAAFRKLASRINEEVAKSKKLVTLWHDDQT